MQSSASSSSPDPLHTSYTNLGHSSPEKAKTERQTRYGAKSRDNARNNSSPSKLLQDFTISTPPRSRNGRFSEGLSRTSYISSTDLPIGVDESQRGSSPWKIRVTVSAEPGEGYNEDEDEEDAEIGRGTGMRTVKVPLRLDNDDDERDGRDGGIVGGRGRGKRRGTGMATTSPVRQASGNRKGKRRSATPARGKRKSLTDLDITVLGDDSDDAKAAKPKRRRSKNGAGAVKRLPKPKVVVDGEEDDGNDVREESTSVGGEEHSLRRKPVVARRDFAIAQDDDVDVDDDSEPVEQEQFPAQDTDSPILRQIDLNKVSIQRTAKTRKNSTAGKDNVSEREASYLTPSLSSSPVGNGAVREHVDQATTTAKDPTEEHHEFDSILESEGFTMISLDSIPSARQFLSSPLELPPQRNVGVSSGSPVSMSERKATAVLPPPPPPPPTTTTTVATALEDESDISSTVPSSSPPAPPKPPVNTISSMLSLPRPESGISRRENRTPEPEQVMSSPKLPSPPRPAVGVVGYPAAASLERKPTSTDVARVMKVGRELQGIVRSPKADQSGRTETPVEKRGAGFRLGNELASMRGGDVPSSNTDRTSHSRLPRPVVTPRSIEIAQAPSQSKKESPYVQKNWVQQEQQWQHEREAVSRQIQMANTSQVIVIDSDDGYHGASPRAGSYAASNEAEAEADHTADTDSHVAHQDIDAGEEEEDIWLQEAHDSSQQSNDNPPSLHVQKLGPQHQQRRRGMIPSPWKRGEGVDQSSTFLSNGDMSGIFWQQPAKRRVSGLRIPPIDSPKTSFDLGKLLGVKETPQKVDVEAKTHGVAEARTEQTSAVRSSVGNDREDENDEEVTGSFQLEEYLGEESDEQENASLLSAPEMTQDEDIEEVFVGSKHDEEISHGESTIADDQPSQISVHGEMDETTHESSNVSDEVSAIPPVKIPVNFGDESSLKKDPNSSTTDPFSTHEDESASESQQATPTSTSKPGTWLDRLTNFRPWGKSEQLTGVPDRAEAPESTLSSQYTDDIEASKTSDDSANEEPSTISESMEQQESSMPASVDVHSEEHSVSSNCRRVEDSWMVPNGADSEVFADQEGDYQPVVSTNFSAHDTYNETSNLDVETTEHGSTHRRGASNMLSASGPWTKEHYRTLHRLYLKSLKRETAKVRSIRADLKCLLYETAQSGSGRHGYTVKMTRKELSVVEEFMRSLEQNSPDQQLGWTAEELTMRLYSIILGYKSRGEDPKV